METGSRRPSGVVRAVLARLVRRYAVRNRQRKAHVVLDLARTSGLKTVLLVGAAVTGKPQDGIVERALDAELDVVSACNIARLALPWPSVVGDARALPYRTRSVDLVVSNAVIEHVGDEADQRSFVAEHDRVGRAWVITTPNRLFPIEPHTATLFRHYRKSWRRDQDDFTRMLTRREFQQLLPPGARIHGHSWSPTLIATGGSSVVTTNAHRRTSLTGGAPVARAAQSAETGVPSARGSRVAS